MRDELKTLIKKDDIDFDVGIREGTILGSLKKACFNEKYQNINK